MRLEDIKLDLMGSKQPKSRNKPKRIYLDYRPPSLVAHLVTDFEINNYTFAPQPYIHNENWISKLRYSLAEQ